MKDVLEIAMESEKLAETIYRKLAEECKKEELKRVYLTLADVERGHYESLKSWQGVSSMEDLEETLERFKDMLLGLSEREILSYWIWGEYEEARIYWGSRKS